MHDLGDPPAAALHFSGHGCFFALHFVDQAILLKLSNGQTNGAAAHIPVGCHCIFPRNGVALFQNPVADHLIHNVIDLNVTGNV